MNITPSVCVIMPFNSISHSKLVYDGGIKKAIESLKFFSSRIDTESKSDSVGSRIRSQIASSYFCIADLSRERPNCYYEIGYAHALGKRVLLIKDEASAAHFDLSDYQHHVFSKKTNIANLLSKIIPEFLASPRREEDDENNHRFGRLPIRDGFRLCAEVIKYRKKRFHVNLEVLSLKKGRKLQGKVRFNLHHTFRKSVQPIQWKHGKAVYEEIQTEGPFTVGAQIEMTGTNLELDLATIPCRYAGWKNKAYRIVDGFVLE